jgi:Txe/YoeB family toxin of Txe-Axe toxin-antitoxin module
VKPVKFSPDTSKKLQRIKSTDLKLFKRIEKKLELFQSDPKHPSLRLHKITRGVENVFSISINKSMRMLYTNLEDGTYFFEIGTHDEVYKEK